MSEEKVIEIKALSPEENLVGKEMETADSEEKSKYYADRGNRQRKKFYDQCIVPYGSRKSRSGCRSGDDLYR